MFASHKLQAFTRELILSLGQGKELKTKESLTPWTKADLVILTNNITEPAQAIYNHQQSTL